jgi:hypothetical protein
MLGALRGSGGLCSQGLGCCAQQPHLQGPLQRGFKYYPSDNERVTGESLGFRYIFPAHVGGATLGQTCHSQELGKDLDS